MGGETRELSATNESEAHDRAKCASRIMCAQYQHQNRADTPLITHAQLRLYWHY